jgi:hypothetical protein
MSAVLVAVFNDYGVAERVRLELFHDGFPTDRVELTASCEPGRAGLEPAESAQARFLQYFRTLVARAQSHDSAERLAAHVVGGAAAIAVHPRGPVEIERASTILRQARPLEIAHCDLLNQTFEHAAAKHGSPWISTFWLENQGHADCIYCRLFDFTHTH